MCFSDTSTFESYIGFTLTPLTLCLTYNSLIIINIINTITIKLMYPFEGRRKEGRKGKRKRGKEEGKRNKRRKKGKERRKRERERGKKGEGEKEKKKIFQVVRLSE